MNSEDGPVPTTMAEKDLKVTVEKDLVSQAEEEDMEALLGTYAFLRLLFLDAFSHFEFVFLCVWTLLCPYLGLTSLVNLSTIIIEIQEYE